MTRIWRLSACCGRVQPAAGGALRASPRGGVCHGLPNGDGPLAGVLHGAAAQREAPGARVDPLQPGDGQAAALLLYDVEVAVLPSLELHGRPRDSARVTATEPSPTTLHAHCGPATHDAVLHCKPTVSGHLEDCNHTCKLVGAPGSVTGAGRQECPGDRAARTSAATGCASARSGTSPKSGTAAADTPAHLACRVA